MGCLSSTRRTRILARIAALEAQLDAADETLERLLSKELSEYRFDSGEGTQQTKRLDVEKLNKIVDNLERRLCWYQSKLDCIGIVNLNLRRKQNSSIL